MTRTDAFKALYFLRVGFLLLACVGGATAAQNGYPVLAAMLILPFVLLAFSGRVQAYFWSELLAGLHHLNLRDYPRSKAHSERFLVQLRERPWLRHLIWLATSSYSDAAEVLALNNLGAAEIALGEIDAAREHLTLAMALDPKCPLLYRNMGALTLRTGSTADAAPWFHQAVALGLKGDWSDARAMASQRHNAAFSTTGVATGASPWPRPAEPPVTGGWLVQVIDDSVTPIEIVVTGLEQVFGLTGAEAIRTARSANQIGHAVCAGFDNEGEAQRKADELTTYAREKGFSLTCTVAMRVWA
jgi:ATP-dependent Clp protease adapter protein ClpS